MKRFVCLLLLVVGIFTACGSGGETLQEYEYEDFRDMVNADDFTGFSYMLTDYQTHEEGYITMIEDVFERTGEQLIYTNVQEYDDDVHEFFNEESRDPDLILPGDKVVYVKEGTVISEFPIENSVLQTDEYNQELQHFIETHQ
ncbi:hypothetical protein [Alteribacillus bidgolensis]|uniref:Uncharacterized protein n=1 Tax=Alteribacillus bidgolensis TaxID=930129 RepID=A0A1G8Q558_9BACI|nr:hypothetical protein [Alteribacillus bidgolensis]SDI99894.1 hypothetical protein SAMN05216352_1184 [Alteribacillus bidgolensis]